MKRTLIARIVFLVTSSIAAADASQMAELSVVDHCAVPPDVIQISRVSSAKSGYLAVYEADHSDRLERLLGKQEFSAGRHSNMLVRLNREVAKTEKLFVVMYENSSSTNSALANGALRKDLVLAKSDFVVRRPLIAPGPYLPLKPSMPLKLLPGQDNKSPFTFLCIPVDCEIRSIAVQVNLEQLRGEVELRLVAPVPGNNNGRPITLYRVKGSQTIDEVFPVTKEESDATMSLKRSFTGLSSRGWYILEITALTPDAHAILKDARLFIEPKGETPEWPTIVPHVFAYHQKIPEGNTVSIDEVISDGAGWIVIYDDDGSGPRQSMYYRHIGAPGGPGQIMGFAPVEPGINHNIKVQVSRKLQVGDVLYAVLHKDTGQKGEFEFQGSKALDAPVIDLVEPNQSTHSWFRLTKEEVEHNYKYYYGY